MSTKDRIQYESCPATGKVDGALQSLAATVRQFVLHEVDSEAVRTLIRILQARSMQAQLMRLRTQLNASLTDLSRVTGCQVRHKRSMPRRTSC